MPLRGRGHSDLVKDEAPYFRSLAELDTWFTQPHNKLSGVLPYQPRPHIDGQSDSRAKLLVCHDYKGGYKEFPSGLSYTFNFWPLCDTFVYFSHHRVTVPPSAWANSAHRHGTKILGTLIFEGIDSTLDSIQLIVGRPDYVFVDNKIPISERYAALLAELAHQRGFDGYLLNFERDLPYESENARALAAWILLLRAQVQARVGSHAEVVWYDSVIYNGEVHYQNRLNGYNLPFFLASDALFTNYWWKPETQHAMCEYLANLLRSDSGTSRSASTTTKTPQNVYSGVDVWPNRGQFGNSGFCCYRAITYSAPLGFSTALFAPGWTWESATEEPEKNWKYWWDNERRFWLGPLKPGEIIPVPDSPEGPFKPMAGFFHPLPPPNPSGCVFYTCFSPGVGYSWFVEGQKVLDTKNGWTDVDKQGSIGNLAWPWPTPSWEGIEQEGVLPTGSTALDMTDGYNGGNTLKLTLTFSGTSEGAVKSIWLPIQSLVATTEESFEVRATYIPSAGNDVDLDARLYAKFLSYDDGDGAIMSVGEASISHLPRGWTQQIINFISISTSKTVSVAIGFLITITPSDPSAEVTLSLSLGQLSVYPSPPLETVSVGMPSITNAKFAPAPHAANDSGTWQEGVLTWDIASTFIPSAISVENKESVVPAWLLQDTPAYRFPAFLYFNVYVVPLLVAVSGSSADKGGDVPSVDASRPVFVGTTGLDGRANRFYVERACLPARLGEQSGALRFYIQGVTDRGEVLPWQSCATVDHRSSLV